MLLLDTDILTIIQLRRGDLYERVAQRIETFAPPAGVSIVSYEEQLRGWLSLIARSRRAEHELVAYSRLMELLADFQERTVVPFDVACARRFEQLRALTADAAQWT